MFYITCDCYYLNCNQIQSRPEHCLCYQVQPHADLCMSNLGNTLTRQAQPPFWTLHICSYSPQFLGSAIIQHHGNRIHWSNITNTKACHLIKPSATSIHLPPPQPTLLRFILMSSSKLLLSLPSGHFPRGFQTKILYAFISPVLATSSAYHSLLDFTAKQCCVTTNHQVSSCPWNILYCSFTSLFSIQILTIINITNYEKILTILGPIWSRPGDEK